MQGMVEIQVRMAMGGIRRDSKEQVYLSGFRVAFATGRGSRKLLVGYALFQNYFHGFAYIFSDCAAYLYFNGQHVPAVAHGHEGTFEGMTIDGAADFHEPACFEKADGIRPDHIGPSALVGSL